MPPLPLRTRLADEFRHLGARRPRWAIFLVALASAVLSCYPVAFFGKSFISPNYPGINLLYEGIPTLPGFDSLEMEDVKGSDVGSTIWFAVPSTRLVSQSIFRDGEWPLWNRYNKAGMPLLGQGITMAGDPLAVISWLSGNASWGWDARYVLAKLLLAWGVGLLVRAATGQLRVALLLAFSSCFLGYFGWRLNHPAFFSLCYGPWILYCWFGIRAVAPGARAMVPWLAGLMLANWAELNSGAVKEGGMLIVCLNFTGMLLLALSSEPVRQRLAKLAQLIGAGVLLGLIATPLLVTFFNALAQSFTLYDRRVVLVAELSQGLGLFDEIFYQSVQPQEKHCLPSANFFVLLGVLLALAQFKGLLANRAFAAVALGALLPAALVFGLVPASLILRTPFLGNILHIANTFSCSLIIHLFVLAGFGLARGWDRLRARRWSADYLVAALLFGTMIACFFSSAFGEEKSAFFRNYALSLGIALLALPLLARRMARHPTGIRWYMTAAVLCFGTLHWRNGMHLSTGHLTLDSYLVNPMERADYDAPSPTLDWLHARQGEPFRASGFGTNLFPGYNAYRGIESIGGCDPLMNHYYRQLLLDGGFPLDWEWRWIAERQTIERILPLCEMLNVRYFLDLPEHRDAPSGGLERVPGLDMDIYEDKAAWPRAFFVKRAARYGTTSELVSLITRQPGQPFAAVDANDAVASAALRNLPPAREDAAVLLATPASDYRLTANTTAFTVRSDGPGLAVLTEAYTDDFQVTVNGKPATCLRVNHAFKGVALDRAGTHRIVFRYWPRRFTLSLWMMAAGWGLLGLWAGLVFFRRTPKEKPVLPHQPAQSAQQTENRADQPA
jgi:hypothetical protein